MKIFKLLLIVFASHVSLSASLDDLGSIIGYLDGSEIIEVRGELEKYDSTAETGEDVFSYGPFRTLYNLKTGELFWTIAPYTFYDNSMGIFRPSHREVLFRPGHSLLKMDSFREDGTYQNAMVEYTKERSLVLGDPREDYNTGLSAIPSLIKVGGESLAQLLNESSGELSIDLTEEGMTISGSTGCERSTLNLFYSDELATYFQSGLVIDFAGCDVLGEIRNKIEYSFRGPMSSPDGVPYMSEFTRTFFVKNDPRYKHIIRIKSVALVKREIFDAEAARFEREIAEGNYSIIGDIEDAGD